MNYGEKQLSIIAPQVYSPYDFTGSQRIFFRSAKGCYLYGEDGKYYIDFVNGKGSVMIGHNADVINKALISMLQENRSNYTGPNNIIVRLSEQILKSVKINEARVAFFGTGTAACRAAVGVARAATGKKLIISAGYHGWDPMWDIWDKDLLVVNEHNMINFFFIPDLLEQIIEKYKDEIALLIMSPDYTYLQKETLLQIIEMCKDNKILICCDDVKQGFRYKYGPSLELITDKAVDMYTFSKGLANGHRISCLVGSADIMHYTERYTFTSYYDMISITAASATLKFMEDNNSYKDIVKRGFNLLELLKEICKESNLPIEVNGFGPIFHFVFGTDELEKAFYREAVFHGICFYEGDNQCLSWSFNNDVQKEFLKRFTKTIEVLADKFKNLKNTYVTKERTFLAAWKMIDGASDIIPVNKRIELIKRYNLK